MTTKVKTKSSSKPTKNRERSVDELDYSVGGILSQVVVGSDKFEAWGKDCYVELNGDSAEVSLGPHEDPLEWCVYPAGTEQYRFAFDEIAHLLSQGLRTVTR